MTRSLTCSVPRTAALLAAATLHVRWDASMIDLAIAVAGETG